MQRWGFVDAAVVVQLSAAGCVVVGQHTSVAGTELSCSVVCVTSAGLPSKTPHHKLNTALEGIVYCQCFWLTTTTKRRGYVWRLGQPQNNVQNLTTFKGCWYSFTIVLCDIICSICYLDRLPVWRDVSQGNGVGLGARGRAGSGCRAHWSGTAAVPLHLFLTLFICVTHQSGLLANWKMTKT